MVLTQYFNIIVPEPLVHINSHMFGHLCFLDSISNSKFPHPPIEEDQPLLQCDSSLFKKVPSPNTNALSACGDWTSPAIPINNIPAHFPVHRLGGYRCAAGWTLLCTCKQFLPCVCVCYYVPLGTNLVSLLQSNVQRCFFTFHVVDNGNIASKKNRFKAKNRHSAI